MKKLLAYTIVICLLLSVLSWVNPTDIAAATSKFQQGNMLAEGFRFSLAVKADGGLWAWGMNDCGQLGDGTTEDRSTPVKIMDNVATVYAGESYAMAIKTDGSLWAWGINDYGQLGNGGKSNFKNIDGRLCQTTPVKVMENAAAVSASIYNTLAIKTDGTLWAWGVADNIQTGNKKIGNKKRLNGEVIQTVPIKIMDKVKAVSSGGSYSMVIKTDGSLWAWGENYFGQLGNGTIKKQITPIKIMNKVKAVSTTEYTAMAIKKDGSLWAWGLNTEGQLGNNGKANTRTAQYHDPIQNRPVKIMDNVVTVSTSNKMAIKSDGSLWGWGNNQYGQLGNKGKGNTKSSDGQIIQTVPIKMMDKVVAVTGTMLVKTDGSLWVLVGNSYGQPRNYRMVNGAREIINLKPTPPKKVLSDMISSKY